MAELVDDRFEPAFTVGGESVEVSGSVDEQAGRDRDRGQSSHLPTAEHGLDKCPAGSAVTVGERVDGLKLGVRDGCLHQRWQVGPADEPDQVGDRVRDPLVVRRNEIGSPGPDAGAADPHLFGAKTSGVGIVSFQQRTVGS